MTTNTQPTKPLRFDMLAVGDRFKFEDWSDNEFTKTATRKAVMSVDMGVAVSGRTEFNVKASAVVQAFLAQ